MVRRGLPRVRRNLVALTAVSVALFAATAGPSSAQVTEVSGSAFGASGSVGLGGGPPFVLAPTPTATLPPTGGNETGSAPSVALQAGPASIVSAGAVNVSTQGTTGAAGSVTSSASLADVSMGTLTATAVSSTCTAAETGVSGSTTVTGGSVILEDPDPDVSGEAGEVVETLPANPAPNTERTGRLNVNNTFESFRFVFNEQTATSTSITVNAVHLFLLGPFAVGEATIGQSVCGVTAGGGGGATTTVVDGVTTTTIVDGEPVVTTTTQPVPGVTTTACPAACPTTTACPTSCPVQPPTTLRVGALVRTGSDSDLTIAWAALALTLGGLLLMGSKGVPGKKS